MQSDVTSKKEKHIVKTTKDGKQSQDCRAVCTPKFG